MKPIIGPSRCYVDRDQELLHYSASALGGSNQGVGFGLLLILHCLGSACDFRRLELALVDVAYVFWLLYRLLLPWLWRSHVTWGVVVGFSLNWALVYTVVLGVHPLRLLHHNVR
jgi:hypothetical protein